MHLSRQQAQVLADNARQAAPNEICGLLAGQQDEVRLIIPIANVAADSTHYFEMSQPEFVRAMFHIQRQGLALIGIYHSHPSGEPIPSTADVAQAQYPDVNYVIIGLGSSQPQIAAWRIQQHRVVNVKLEYDSIAAQSSELELSTSGQVAIVLSAIIAVVLALLISLSLLPPAPIIP